MITKIKNLIKNEKILLIISILLLCFITSLLLVNNKKSTNENCLDDIQNNLIGEWLSGPSHGEKTTIKLNKDSDFNYSSLDENGILTEREGVWNYDSSKEEITLKFNNIDDVLKEFEQIDTYEESYKGNELRLNIDYANREGFSNCDASRYYIDFLGENLFKFIDKVEFEDLNNNIKNKNECINLTQYLLTKSYWIYEDESLTIQLILNDNGNFFIVHFDGLYKEVSGQWNLIEDNKLRLNFNDIPAEMKEYFKDVMFIKENLLELNINYNFENSDNTTCNKKLYSIELLNKTLNIKE